MSWYDSLAQAFFDIVFDITPISCHAFTLPECLARWIDASMPALKGVRQVSFYCCDSGDIPIGPIMNLVGARGLTLGDHVHIRHSLCPIDPCDPEKVRLLLHELVHVEQYRADPGFPVKYIADHLRFGYVNNPAEIAARARAQTLLGAYMAANPCECDFPPPAAAPPLGDGGGGPPTPPPLGSPPSEAPTPISAKDMAACCAAHPHEKPELHAAVRYPGRDAEIIVWATATCGVKTLVLHPEVSSPGAAGTALATVELGGTECVSYRLARVRYPLRGGSILTVRAEATSCCDGTATRSFAAQ